MNTQQFQMPSIEEIKAQTAAQVIRPALTERLDEIEAIAAHHGGEVFALNRHNTRIRLDSFASVAEMQGAMEDIRQAGLFARETWDGFVVTGVESDW